MSNYGRFGSFELNSIFRGAQLTIVGANRGKTLERQRDGMRTQLTPSLALQNPGIFTSDHYRQAALAVAAGIAIRILVAIPVCCVRHEAAFCRLTILDIGNPLPSPLSWSLHGPARINMG